MIDSQKRLFKGLGISTKNNIGSHPMWVRGLKHRVGEPTGDKSKSHPMWVRGLKRRGHVATDTTDQSYLVHYFL